MERIKKYEYLLPIIIFIFTFIAFVNTYAYTEQEKIAKEIIEAKVIEVYENKVEVQITDGGRVFISNFEDVLPADLKYGDYVEVILDHRVYKVVGIIEE